MPEQKTPKLDARLSLLWEFVRPGGVVADIGCDHGYLSAALVGSGKCPRALCCDIHEGPLWRAKETARLYDLTEKMDFRLTDGLEGVSPGEADDIVIAGMGGDLIARIVLETPWLRSGDKHLVLSPMSKAQDLRRALCEHGFSILREQGVREGRFVYTVMAVTFTGERFSPDEVYARTGALPLDGAPDSWDYLRHQAQIVRKIAENLQKSNTYSNKSNEYNEIADKIQEMIESGGRKT
ncbi:class I SAM-dependent methyltransferase [Zongyangia hominis]|uniref:SAM-dependent methyltransferase n=1 Tax=Zongyangia hominis TaxID=2763677 RepID=A0A926IAG3_9FIRM|nr:class I SAM-dependent methyltransferase [Zongyangia hominis]MBC8570181.1 SAM-dependent methyltransferase [Zongyangia hominis]